MDGNDKAFECFQCGERFGPRLFTLTCSLQKQDYADERTTVHVAGECTVATYCGADCRQLHIEHAMAEEGIPIPAHTPGTGPVEVCAICQGPVNMTAFHICYVATEEIESMPDVMQVVHDRTIAVVCAQCLPPDLPEEEAAGALLDARKDDPLRTE